MSEAVLDEEKAFSIDSIRSAYLPATLSDKQTRAGVCLIRNPDAPISRIAHKTGVSAHTVMEALRGVVHGDSPTKDQAGDVWARRGSTRMAETYDELTPKQQAVVDWLARHPGNLSKLLDLEDENLTGPNVADAIATDERYDVMVSESYPIRVAQQYTRIIREHREDLAAAGELEDEEVAIETIRDLPPREWLDRAGYALPEANLDDLEPAPSTTEDPRTDQERLEEAFERAEERRESAEEPVTEEDRREYPAPYSCPECGHEGREEECSKCGADKRYEWAKEEDPDEEPPEEDGTGLDALFGEDNGLEEVKGEIGNLHVRLNRLEERMVTERALKSYHADQEERLSEFEDRVWEALHNSVGSSLMDRVEAVEEDLGTTRGQVDTLRHDSDDLHERLKRLEASHAETVSLVEEMEGPHLDEDLLDTIRTAREMGVDVEISLTMGVE